MLKLFGGYSNSIENILRCVVINILLVVLCSKWLNVWVWESVIGMSHTCDIVVDLFLLWAWLFSGWLWSVWFHWFRCVHGLFLFTIKRRNIFITNYQQFFFQKFGSTEKIQCGLTYFYRIVVVNVSVVVIRTIGITICAHFNFKQFRRTLIFE